MKYLPFLLLMVAAFTGYTQKQCYQIIVKVKNLQKGSYLIMDDEYSDKQTKLYFQPNKGQFFIKGEVKDTTLVRLMLIHQPGGVRKDAITLFLVPGTTFITTPDSLFRSTLSGTRQNADLQVLKNLFTAHPSPKAVAGSQKDKTQPQPASGGETTDMENQLAQFITSHPSSLASLGAIQTIAETRPAVAAKYFRSLSPNIRFNKLGKNVGHALINKDKIAIGSPAPEITQYDLEVKMFHLSSLHGKYVLLSFWASWCPPCRIENNLLADIYQRLHPKGLEIVSVSLDRPAEKKQWLDAVKKDQLTWINISDLKFMMNEAALSYGVQTIPDNFIIDPDGKIVAHSSDANALNQQLNTIFQPKPVN